MRWKKETKSLLVRSVVIDKEGHEIASTETKKDFTNFNPSNLLSQQIEIEQPKLWSTSTPSMYFLKSEIISDGQVLDDQVTSFGIRKLEYIPNKGLFVNGKSEKTERRLLSSGSRFFWRCCPSRNLASSIKEIERHGL